jgi:hypothetical protein
MGLFGCLFSGWDETTRVAALRLRRDNLVGSLWLGRDDFCGISEVGMRVVGGQI